MSTTPVEPAAESPTALADRLLTVVHSYLRPIIAFSGGVDSAVVAAAAVRGCELAVAVTAVSPSLAAGELDEAKQVAAAISAKRTSLTPDEAKDLAVRAVQFKKERGRIPALDSQDAWERRMAEGAAAFMRFRAEGRYE